MEKTTQAWERGVTVEGATTPGWSYDEEREKSPRQVTENRGVVQRILAPVAARFPQFSPRPKDVRIGARAYSMIQVFIEKGALPAPFNHGVTLWGCSIPYPANNSKTNIKLAAYYSDLLIRMIDKRDDALIKLKETYENLKGRSAGSGVEIDAVQIESVGMTVLSERLEYSMLAETRLYDDSLQPVRAIYQIRPHNRQTTTQFMLDVRQQATRRERLEHGEHLDITLWHALQAMAPEARQALYDHLRKNRNTSSHTANQWTTKQCLAAGIVLPDAVETIKTKNGILTGRIRLSDQLIYNRNRFTAAITLGETIRDGAVGRPLEDVIQHPWLPAKRPILRCENGVGKTYITIDPYLVTLDGEPVDA